MVWCRNHVRRYIAEKPCMVSYKKQNTNWDDKVFPWVRSCKWLCCLKWKHDTCGVRRSFLCKYVFGLFNIFSLIYMPDIAYIKWFNSNVLHIPPYVGYPGYQKTTIAIMKQLFWPKIEDRSSGLPVWPGCQVYIKIFEIIVCRVGNQDKIQH